LKLFINFSATNLLLTDGAADSTRCTGLCHGRRDDARSSTAQARIEDRKAEARVEFWSLGVRGSAVSSLSGVWAELQPKLNLVHISKKKSGI